MPIKTMKTPFELMSEEDFNSYSPTNDRDIDLMEDELVFREWWKENLADDENLSIEEARELYMEVREEYGDKSFENMGEEDREGWEHNIIKSFD